ncbi:hypothetical protein PMIT1306_00505 [Prochlorococcus sp. MIT 1306]|nr:hypothetical protein PMIT1306_00505 [Prochlorococcus sp. MIT 1306]
MCADKQWMRQCCRISNRKSAKKHSQETLLGPNQQTLAIKARATRKDQLLDWSGLNVCDYDDVAEPCVCTSRLGSRGDECA